MIRADGDGVLIDLKVVPGARRARLMGPLGDAIKLSVTQPPEAGAANAGVIDLLAETLGVARRQVAIVAGLASPRKTARVSGISLIAAQKALGLD